MAASSHLGGFVRPLKGRSGSDGQNRVCVTLISRDAFGRAVCYVVERNLLNTTHQRPRALRPRLRQDGLGGMMLHLRRDLPHGGLPCVQSSGAMLVVARLAESWLLLGNEVASELGGLVVGRARECDYSANAMCPDAVRLRKIWSGNCIPTWATRPDYEYLVWRLPMKQAKLNPPPHTNKNFIRRAFCLCTFYSSMTSHTIVAVARSRCPAYPGAPLLRPPSMPPRLQPATPPT